MFLTSVFPSGKTIKTFLVVCLGLFSLFLLPSCSQLGYVVDQGIGQWRLFNRARPINNILTSPFTRPKTKQAIRLVQEAKAFAVTELGLNATNSYQSFVNLDRPALSYVVAASHSLLLESRTWDFPIVGKVPYLGFFDRNRALDFAEKIRREPDEPDVFVRAVQAFSSLGWFPDPLYSSMIEGSSDRQIVETVIHESLHATLWIGDSVDFNESLANFIGVRGSLLFVYKKYPGDKEREKKALEEVIFDEKFANFIEKQIDLYKEKVKSLQDKQIFYLALADRWQAFKDESGLRGERPLDFSQWNNATLLAFGNYSQDFSDFEALLANCDGSLARFIGWLKKEKGRLAVGNQLKEISKESCPSL